MGGTSVLFITRSINCSCVSFGNPMSSRSNGSSSICNASSRTVSSAMVSLNSCCNFNLFKTFCCSSIASLNLIFCSNAARFAFTSIKVSFEERREEPDADVIFDDLRDEPDRKDVISSLSIAFIL